MKNDQCHDLPRHISIICNPGSGWMARQRLLKWTVLCLIFVTTLLSLWMIHFCLVSKQGNSNFAASYTGWSYQPLVLFCLDLTVPKHAWQKLQQLKNLKRAQEVFTKSYSKHVTKTAVRTWIPTDSVQSHFKTVFRYWTPLHVKGGNSLSPQFMSYSILQAIIRHTVWWQQFIRYYVRISQKYITKVHHYHQPAVYTYNTWLHEAVEHYISSKFKNYFCNIIYTPKNPMLFTYQATCSKM